MQWAKLNRKAANGTVHVRDIDAGYWRMVFPPPQGKKNIQAMATKIAETERQFGMDTSVEDCLRELKFGLVEVVYEWARGMVSDHIIIIH